MAAEQHAVLTLLRENRVNRQAFSDAELIQGNRISQTKYLHFPVRLINEHHFKLSVHYPELQRSVCEASLSYVIQIHLLIAGRQDPNNQQQLTEEDPVTLLVGLASSYKGQSRAPHLAWERI